MEGIGSSLPGVPGRAGQSLPSRHSVVSGQSVIGAGANAKTNAGGRSAVRGRLVGDYKIEQVDKKLETPESGNPAYNWKACFEDFPRYPKAIIDRMKSGHRKRVESIDKESCFLFNDICAGKGCVGVDDESYQDIIKKCRNLHKDLEPENYPAIVSHYIKSKEILIEVLYLDACLQSGLSGYQLSCMASIKDVKEYLVFLHALAEAASGQGVIPVSRHLQRFCQYKAADAGCETSKRVLVKEMLFCRAHKRDPLACHLFYPPEAIELLMTLNTQADSSGYDQIIDRLHDLIHEPDEVSRKQLADNLINDKRREVQVLAPMFYLDPRFGEVNPVKAKELIDLLPEGAFIDKIRSYWLCRFAFANNEADKQQAVDHAISLLDSQLTAIWHVVLDEYDHHGELFSLKGLIKLYKYINDNGFLLPRSLAYRMTNCFDLIYFLKRFKTDDVSQASDKCLAVAVAYGYPEAVADALYESSGELFSAENWKRSVSDNFPEISEKFLEVLSDQSFSQDPVVGIFQCAVQAMKKRRVDWQLINRAYKWDALKTLYWMLVLNCFPENGGMSDLAKDFLQKSRNELGCIIPFVHTTSFSAFIQRIYHYAYYSAYPIGHPLFHLYQLLGFLLEKSEQEKCLMILSEVKSYHGMHSEAVACVKRAKGIPSDGECTLPLDYPVMKVALMDDYKLFLELKSQQEHPIGDLYKYKKIVSILEHIDQHNDVRFYDDFFCLLIGFVTRQCASLGASLESSYMYRLFEGCGRMASRIKTISLEEAKGKYSALLVWYNDLPEVVRQEEDVVELNNVNECLKKIITKWSSSDKVCLFRIDPDQIDHFNHDYYHSVEEHNIFVKLRTVGRDEEFVALIEQAIGSLPSIDTMELVDQALYQFNTPESWLCKTMVIIERQLEKYFTEKIDLEFYFTLMTLNTMKSYLEKKDVGNSVNISKIRLRYFSLIAEMVLRGQQVISRLFANNSNRFLSLCGIALEGKPDQQVNALVAASIFDIRRLSGFCPLHARECAAGQQSVQEADFVQMASDESMPLDQRTLADCMGCLIRGDKSALVERIKAIVIDHPGDTEIQCDVLWLGYEVGVLAGDDYQKQIIMLDEDSPEYFFHSILATDSTDHPNIVALQNARQLTFLEKTQLETVGLKLVELGCISDALWLANTYDLKYLGVMLAWHHDEEFDKNNDKIPEKLIAEAETGCNQAQCRLVDWVLIRKKAAVDNSENADAEASGGVEDQKQQPHSMSGEYIANNENDTVQPRSEIEDKIIDAHCCLYLHIPCIWSNAQRLLYQGVALCSGVGCETDSVRGLEKINEALASDDPVVPFALYWLQTSLLLEQTYVQNERLLLDFSKRMPDFGRFGRFGRKVLTELIVNFGELEVRRVANEMKAIAGQKEGEERKKLEVKSKSILQWLDCWRKQVDLQKKSPVEKVSYYFDVEISKGWPVQNLAGLKDRVAQLSNSQRDSDFFQEQLIFYVKRLGRLSKAHKEFAKFLGDFITSGNWHRLLVSDGRGKKLYWDAEIVAQDKKLTLFRKMPVHRQQSILQSLWTQIKSREQLFESADVKRMVDRHRIPGILVAELIKEVKETGISITRAKLGNHVKNVVGDKGKRYTYYELLQFCSLVDTAGLKQETILDFRRTIRAKAVDLLKEKNIVLTNKENEREVLSQLAIYMMDVDTGKFY